MGRRVDPEANRARVRAWYRANRERALERYRQWASNHPDEVRDNYNRWLSVPANRAKTYAASNARRRAHPERRFVQDQRRRARLREAFVEDVDRREVVRLHNGICGWCGEPVDPTNFHVDHIVALCLGGEHSYANTQPAHPECNIAKRVALKERAT